MRYQRIQYRGQLSIRRPTLDADKSQDAQPRADPFASLISSKSLDLPALRQEACVQHRRPFGAFGLVAFDIAILESHTCDRLSGYQVIHSGAKGALPEPAQQLISENYPKTTSVRPAHISSTWQGG